jgi:hypothetical protein
MPAGGDGKPALAGVRRTCSKGQHAVFPPEIEDLATGTPFAINSGMSPVGRALHERFEEVCRTELQRLHRKTASLTASERREVDAISVAVTQGIAARFEAALAGPDGAHLSEIVARLFAVAPDESAREPLGVN